jgi:adenine-specific DNA methylase
METKDKRIMAQAKKLIEVAMPIKEISAESVRDKSIRSGHISTLHLWWARRPLPVCRAVVFASLVPDPLDENCPKQFKEAVENLLGSAKKPLQETGIPSDAFKPYDDIPYTAAIDKMFDNNRNRLMMFIGKFSNEYSTNEKVGKATPTAKLISDYSLIKWENKDNELIISKARKLIWVAHNAKSGNSYAQLIADYFEKFDAIKNAEHDLYNFPNRHIVSAKSKELTEKLQNAIDTFLSKMPKVFDPFAGGGAIPLEAARLGCKSFGNDINPVAHIIQKGSLEFPQKYGKPITYSSGEFIKLYGQKEFDEISKDNKLFNNGDAGSVTISNRLKFDVEFYAKKLLSVTEKEIGHLYPVNKKGESPIVYYWVRVGTCSNPTCKAEVPLLRQFYLSKRRSASISEYVYFDPIIEGNKINLEIKKGTTEREPFIERANLKCPVCGSITEVKKLKKQFADKTTKEILAAVIEDSKSGKIFRKPFDYEIEVLQKIGKLERPNELMPQNDSQNLKIPFWGYKSFGEMFSDRQMAVMLSLVSNLDNIDIENNLDEEYTKAISTYLAMLIDRVAMRYTTFNTWHIQQDTVEKIMGKQAIPMVFDYPEMNPFTQYTSSAINQLDQILDYIRNESANFNIANCQNAASGDKSQFDSKFLNAVITDPPYYDAIAYADLSDFFYVWLKRTVGKRFALNFATPNTPKSEECTAIKHNHNGSREIAKQHFEEKLLQIFDAIEHQTEEIVSIMFAHQSTEAWTTLCNSILGARMNITGSWAVDTEVTGGLKEGKAYLSSSVTVSCIPSQKSGLGDYKVVKNAIEKTVAKEVEELYSLGFRGADLLTACFGQAVSEFGKYEKVEKADGSEVTVADLLEMARESAFNALLKGFDGDDFTKFYIGWLQLYSFAESDFDDAAKFSRVGLSINVAELFTEHILIKNGNKQTLGTFEERLSENKNIGDKANNFLIDEVHRAMALYKGTNRTALLQYIGKVAAQPESNFWRVITSLCEVLPNGSEDHKQAIGLLSNKDSLIRESKTTQTASSQTNLFE